MAKQSVPEFVAGVLLLAGAAAGGAIGVNSGHGASGQLSEIVRCIAGVAVGAAVTVVVLGLAMFAFEGVKALGGRPSHEPTLTDVAPQETSVADARMYSVAAVVCLVIGVFIAVILLWFFALIFALLARRASGDDKQWRRATTVLWVATACALTGMFLLGSGLIRSN